VTPRLEYWRRIFQAYVAGGNSHLTFWHERPALNEKARYDALGPYYMTFADKARYPGPFDSSGVPMLDYRGRIGRRYNPIAIAQYGLALHNRWREGGKREDRARFLAQASWLRDNLETNARGVRVWNHHFDFEYRETLRDPWYSGLAQGQGLSLLARAHAETGEAGYLESLRAAFGAFGRETGEGGVLHREPSGDVWIEEYIVSPPSHILNGFIWALWGVRDYRLHLGDPGAEELFGRCVATLERNLERYDTGLWSLYELSGNALPMVASRFYHALHVVQLEVLERMTGRPAFGERARRWRAYAEKRLNRGVSLAQKCAFKLLYY
jgi:hypothetical protein